MAASQHVEVEAAKLLHKLIQESKDEPAKLATKLYVICHHMKLSGKEQSLPYQVISRAMETVINQHGLDIDALRQSRFPLTGGPQKGDPSVPSKDQDISENQFAIAGVPSISWQAASTSQAKEEVSSASLQSNGILKDPETVPGPADIKQEFHAFSRVPVGMRSTGNVGLDIYQASVAQKYSRSSEHGSPASIRTEDSQSTNSQDRPESVNCEYPTNKKETKKPAGKRKRVDSKAAAAGGQSDSLHQSNAIASRMGKQICNSGAQSQVVPEEGVLSSSNVYGLQKGGFFPPRANMLNSAHSWNQNQFAPQSGDTQVSFPGFVESCTGVSSELPVKDFKDSPYARAENSVQPTNLMVSDVQSSGKITSTHGAISSYLEKAGLPTPTYHKDPLFGSQDISKLYKETNPEDYSTLMLDKGKNVMDDGKYMLADGAFSQPTASLQVTQVGGQECQSKDYTSGNPELVYNHQNVSGKLVLDANLNAEQSGGTEMSALRSMHSRSHTSDSASLNMPFKEHQLKQLRAQCLVFLAFRNNLMPRKLHLEIALGGNYPRKGSGADGHPGHVDGKTMESFSKEPGNHRESSDMLDRPTDVLKTTEGSSSAGSILEIGSYSKDPENTNHRSKLFAELENEKSKLHSVQNSGLQWIPNTAESNDTSMLLPDSTSAIHGGRNALGHFGRAGLDQTSQPPAWRNQYASVGTSSSLKSDVCNRFPARVSDDPLRQSPAATIVQHEEVSGGSERMCKAVLSTEETTNASHHSSTVVKHPESQTLRSNGEPSNPIVTQTRDSGMRFPQFGNYTGKTAASESALLNNSSDNYPGNDGSNCLWLSINQKQDIQPRYGSDAMKALTRNGGPGNGLVEKVVEKPADGEEEDIDQTDDVPASPPKYTTSEKWILDQQKRRENEEQKWILKHRKAEESIGRRFEKLKENVNLSEDLSAKTRSVIELKKLQLLKLQRRLRGEFLSDFYKPIMSDMERLKSVKKHKHGRRVKQLEKFEQKMREERQKRIRERQKEFFSEVEAHKDRLEDCFKIKRERWRSFNRFAKEYHKRRERIHREKIDRIQREKINLLKNNDVEGYLRMVQDAKSDRVKQLLKETEKYLQKLGAKLQDAKVVARKFEMEMDEGSTINDVEKSEIIFDNEDESDQAQHYLESNEKYYMMAHTVKENINEQPRTLEGGKLREYQMNGLRWLVSLYNNHLNGILADEMGLGKTVQVISLICYLMETKNDKGPFLVVVPSSVLPGWESEIKFWAPTINKITYAGPPEERRRLFKERVVHQKFNVLLTTYEYLMNKHDRPKLSKVQWHYIIIDEGHRIKNASCKLNADLRHYQSSHRLLLTGTPLQNNLDELWALLNFLLPNIFNSSEDFSQWFNKPFQSNVDSSPDEALLSEEENLLIINRLHQVLRPFVLRRLKHKVENELPEKIERLVRCEASAYQKLLMKRVEENLGYIGTSKGRSIHNTVMELRNICNHPYISQLHAEQVDSLIPVHYLPPIVRLCGKLEMLDRLLPKLKATDHRVLFFSTMTRLLDVMEEYLTWKRYKYLRLDGHTSGSDRGALIEEFNRPGSQAFIFLLSIRAGGVGVNLQAADTVILFDTDWNPQVDLQAQARAHRIGQKKDVLVLRLETVRTVEEQVRASAEHKLGVANQSITAGFFDNNTSAEDRREYLENLLRECKKEEAAAVLDDDALNDLIARSESELDVFESVDKQRREEEMAAWKKIIEGRIKDGLEPLFPPSRLLTEDDLQPFYKAMKLYETPSTSETTNIGVKRRGEAVGALDTQHYGRGKRAREVRSYEDQWTEEEFEKLCQADSPGTPQPVAVLKEVATLEALSAPVKGQQALSVEPQTMAIEPQGSKEPPPKRGRGRPKRTAAITTTTVIEACPPVLGPSTSSVVPSVLPDMRNQEVVQKLEMASVPAIDVTPAVVPTKESTMNTQSPTVVVNTAILNPAGSVRQGKGRKSHVRETPRRRGRKQSCVPSTPALENSGTLGIAKGTHELPPTKVTVMDRTSEGSSSIANVPSASVTTSSLSKPCGESMIALSSNEKGEIRNECTGHVLAEDLGGLKSGSIVDKAVFVCAPDSSNQRQVDPEPKQLEAKQAESIEKVYVEQSNEPEIEDVSCAQKSMLEPQTSKQLLTSSGGDGEESITSPVKTSEASAENRTETTAGAVVTPDQVLSYTSKDVGMVPAAVKRGPENKSSVIRKKAAAREPRNRSNMATANCERRARAGMKQAEGSKKSGSTRNVGTARVNEKSESDSIHLHSNLEQQHLKLPDNDDLNSQAPIVPTKEEHDNKETQSALAQVLLPEKEDSKNRNAEGSYNGKTLACYDTGITEESCQSKSSSIVKVDSLQDMRNSTAIEVGKSTESSDEYLEKQTLAANALKACQDLAHVLIERNQATVMERVSEKLTGTTLEYSTDSSHENLEMQTQPANISKDCSGHVQLEPSQATLVERVDLDAAAVRQVVFQQPHETEGQNISNGESCSSFPESVSVQPNKENPLKERSMHSSNLLADVEVGQPLQELDISSTEEITHRGKGDAHRIQNVAPTELCLPVPESDLVQSNKENIVLEGSFLGGDHLDCIKASHTHDELAVSSNEEVAHCGQLCPEDTAQKMQNISKKESCCPVPESAPTQHNKENPEIEGSVHSSEEVAQHGELHPEDAAKNACESPVMTEEEHVTSVPCESASAKCCPVIGEFDDTAVPEDDKSNVEESSLCHSCEGDRTEASTFEAFNRVPNLIGSECPTNLTDSPVNRDNINILADSTGENEGGETMDKGSHNSDVSLPAPMENMIVCQPYPERTPISQENMDCPVMATDNEGDASLGNSGNSTAPLLPAANGKESKSPCNPGHPSVVQENVNIPISGISENDVNASMDKGTNNSDGSLTASNGIESKNPPNLADRPLVQENVNSPTTSGGENEMGFSVDKGGNFSDVPLSAPEGIQSENPPPKLVHLPVIQKNINLPGTSAVENEDASVGEAGNCSDVPVPAPDDKEEKNEVAVTESTTTCLPTAYSPESKNTVWLPDDDISKPDDACESHAAAKKAGHPDSTRNADAALGLQIVGTVDDACENPTTENPNFSGSIGNFADSINVMETVDLLDPFVVKSSDSSIKLPVASLPGRGGNVDNICEAPPSASVIIESSTETTLEEDSDPGDTRGGIPNEESCSQGGSPIDVMLNAEQSTQTSMTVDVAQGKGIDYVEKPETVENESDAGNVATEEDQPLTDVEDRIIESKDTCSSDVIVDVSNEVRPEEMKDVKYANDGGRDATYVDTSTLEETGDKSEISLAINDTVDSTVKEGETEDAPNVKDTNDGGRDADATYVDTSTLENEDKSEISLATNDTVDSTVKEGEIEDAPNVKDANDGGQDVTYIDTSTLENEDKSEISLAINDTVDSSVKEGETADAPKVKDTNDGGRDADATYVGTSTLENDDKSEISLATNDMVDSTVKEGQTEDAPNVKDTNADKDTVESQ